MHSDFNDMFDEEPHIDLTPMIDCLFMLIIFFVLTMSFSRPVLEIVLPQADDAQVEQSRREVLVSVDAQGRLWLDTEEITIGRLEAVLEARSDDLLNLYMDRRTPFEVFVRVLEVAKKKRGGRFVISTQSTGGAS